MYTKLTAYYDSIFKDNPAEKAFIKAQLKPEDKKAFDLGCGTGKTALCLASFGLQTIAVDINETMISYAKKKHAHPNLEYRVLDISKLMDLKGLSNGDIITCFGNTLVHLQKEEIINFFNTLYQQMKKGGRLLIQVINYDRIFHHQIKSLPIIEDEQLKFIRTYDYHEKESHIIFHTEVHLKKENKTLVDEVVLYPRTKKELLTYAISAGFVVSGYYGSFKKEVFIETDSYHFILVLEKANK